jgi:hypothetical protein
MIMKRYLWLYPLVLVTGGIAGFEIGYLRCMADFTGKPPFVVVESRVDFENDKFILKTKTVQRSTPALLDTSRWVVTITDKASGQSMALMTSHPSFTTDPWDDFPKFSETSDGFRYTSDIAVLTMKWPEMSFRYQSGFSVDDSCYLGAPRR